MSAPIRAYRFATDRQWSACLQVSASPDAIQDGRGITPFQPIAVPPTLYRSNGAFAPVVTRGGVVMWRDARRGLHRLTCFDDPAETLPAPAPIACATRLVETTAGVWALSDTNERLVLYERDTFARMLAVDLPDFAPVDIASAGRGAVWALVEAEDGWQAVRISPAGRKEAGPFFRSLDRGKEARPLFVFLRRSRRFVVLGRDRYQHQRLFWYSAEGGAPLFSRPVRPLQAHFVAHAIANDTRDRLYLGGQNSDECGGAALVLVLDADGNLLSEVPIERADAPVTGIAATGNSLLVTGARGLLRFTTTDVVPEGATQARTFVITPALFSPDREDGRRWLRVEASADLPEGSTLEIAVASTDDSLVRDRMNAIASDTSKTASERADQMLAEPEFWRTIGQFHGVSDLSNSSSEPLAARLFQIRDRFVWVHAALTAAPGARLPRMKSLAVLYPGQTLMEHLPSIYQREENQPDSFFRSFIGVLETTTQGLDARIASMGSLVHPDTAPVEWLNVVARWLGLPWDDGLSPEQKRSLVGRAAELAKHRGTRAGLEALLESLIPGTPRRFRITDATADFGFAVVGDPSGPGSALPALLGGRPRWAAELDAHAVLGAMRLPCEGQIDDGVYQLAGKVRIEIAATAAERAAWQPWLESLITDMVPMNVRIDLRWVSERALRSDRIDGTLTLEGTPHPHLGTDAITGVARFSDEGARLSSFGAHIPTRLR